MSGGAIKNPNSLANLAKGGFKKGYQPWNKGKNDAETHTWKGDNAGYVALHLWVKKHLGSKSQCEWCGSKDRSPRSYHWANLSGEYKRDLTDWLRLCINCHFALDRQLNRWGKTRKAYLEK